MDLTKKYIEIMQIIGHILEILKKLYFTMIKYRLKCKKCKIFDTVCFIKEFETKKLN